MMKNFWKISNYYYY